MTVTLRRATLFPDAIMSVSSEEMSRRSNGIRVKNDTILDPCVILLSHQILLKERENVSTDVIGYSDTLGNGQKCHCKRLSL